MKQYLTFSEEQKKAFNDAMHSKFFSDFLTKANEANAKDSGSFRVIISTADFDRQGESVIQEGIDLTFYKTNRVVLWAHDYAALPIGVCTNIYLEDGKLIAEGKFAPEDANPFAQQVRRLYDAGIVRATSVGFIPHEWGDDNTITKSELLEFSFVPVPANPYALSLSQMKELGIDKKLFSMKGINFKIIEKAVVPYASHGKASEDTAWDAGKEVKECGDDLEKLKSICTWYNEAEKDKKSAYKLPHHEANGLKAVWHGVAAAMGAIMGARGGAKIPSEDHKGVYNHLAKHYKEFDKEVPEYEKAMELSIEDREKIFCFKSAKPGDRCSLDDGTAGVLGNDPHDPEGPLVCVPEDTHERSNDETVETDAVQVFKDAMDDEHNRHHGALTKALEVFKDEMKAIDIQKGIDIEKTEPYENLHKKVALENQRHSKEMQKHIEVFCEAMDEGNDDEGQPTTEGHKGMSKDHYEIVKEAMEHIKAAHDTLGGIKPADGDDNEPDNDEDDPEHKGQRSKTLDSEVNDFIISREALRGVDKIIGKALETLNTRAREFSGNTKK